MNDAAAMVERPAELTAGVSGRGERRWGLIGGAMGAAIGLGSALIAVYVEGAEWRSSAPYPAFFRLPRLLVYDRFLFAMLIVGAAFLVGAIVLARVSRFPRTDASGASLAGTILVLLSGTLLFTRLAAIASAR